MDSDTRKPMNTEQPTFPSLPDFTQPVEVKGSELSATIKAAQSEGFHCHRMTVQKDVIYRLQFFRVASPAANVGTPAHVIGHDDLPDPFKESPWNPQSARHSCTPACPYATKIYENTRK